MPVKIGIPTGFSGGLVREIENPSYATAVGLVIHGLKHQDRASIKGDPKRARTFRSMTKKMKEWFDEL
jgi:cell division protein FtsA